MALSDGLVGYWSPWLGSSGYTLVDQSHFTNHGTLTNMDAGTDYVGFAVQGQSGYALDFDGSNDYVQTANTINFGSLTSWSQSAWINPANTTGTKGFFGVDTNGAGPEFRLNGAGLNYLRQGAFNIIVATGTVVANRWQMATVAYNRVSGVYSLWLNGITIATGTATTTGWSNCKMQISAFTVADHWNGRIASASFWSRSITSSEVQDLVRLGPGWYRPYSKRGYGYALAGFKAYWHRRQQQIIGGGLR